MTHDQVNESVRIVREAYGRMMGEMSRQGARQEDEPYLFGNSAQEYVYFHVEGVARKTECEDTENKNIPLWNSMLQQLYVGLFAIGAPVSVVYLGDGKKVSTYIGSKEEYLEILKGMLQGVLPQITFERSPSGGAGIIRAGKILCPVSGFLKGDPSENTETRPNGQIDAVIKGMAGKSWTMAVFASPENTPEGRRGTWERLQRLMQAATQYSKLTELTFSETESVENISCRQSFFEGEQFLRKLSEFCAKEEEGLAIGEWHAVINYGAANEADTRLLGALLTAAFYGENSVPEPVHIIRTSSARNAAADTRAFKHYEYCGCEYPRYASILTSRELAVYTAFPLADTGGIAVTDYTDFDVERSDDGDLEIGKILEAGRVTDNGYMLDVNQLNRHCLVAGLTGSGKTNTLKTILHNMTGRHIPFMVIEPAKKEYWELYKLGMTDLQIYSVGSSEPGCHRLCINPFERPVYTDENGVEHKVSLQTHIDFVYSAFKASFIMYTPMPYVLEQAIFEIYEDCGWDIQNDTCSRAVPEYPTIEDLYYKIPAVVTAMGYDKKMRSDLTGSLQSRINSMRLGSKGETLNVLSSFPFEKLLQGNTVVELEDIGDDDVKAFIISLLLINLAEVRRSQEDCQLSLRHIILIEEAHRLLKNVQSGTGENADPRGAAVEFFCNLLAELRSKGQGFIVADQIPSKLAPDLVKNTNMKIIHRIVAGDDRELVGAAMHMTERQMDALASLKQGQAAVYSEGDNRPKLVKPGYAGAYQVPAARDMTRTQILEAVSGNCISAQEPRYRSLTNQKPAGCRACDLHCRKHYTDILGRIAPEKFSELSGKYDPYVTKQGFNYSQLSGEIYRFLQVETGSACNEDVMCLYLSLVDSWKNLTAEYKATITAGFAEGRHRF